MSIEELTVFFGWMSVINIGILFFTTFMVVVMRDFATKIHAKMFSIPAETLPAQYFEYLGRYKILVIFFNIVPYLTLRLVMG